MLARSALSRAAGLFSWDMAPAEDAYQDVDKPEDRPIPIIRTDDDLDDFLSAFFGVTLPNRPCCEGHTTPWQAFHDAYFARSPVSVWKASRGFGGKSFTLALLGLVEALTLRADVNILGGSGEQSRRVLENMAKLWESETAPKEYLVGDPGRQKQRFRWGNTVVALLASQRSVRGPHPQRLRLDEIDEMDMSLMKSALGQPMSKGQVLSQVVMSSTHQYADGTMTWALKEAAENGQGWAVYEWCLQETLEPHGWLTHAELTRKQAVMTADTWKTEVLLQEPTSEGRAFDLEKVEAAFDDLVRLEDPDPDGRYGTGGDWAKKVNHTVVVTIRSDVTPARVVAIKRDQKRAWPAMIGLFDDQFAQYGGSATHDNTGLGQVVHDLLERAADPFDMVGKARSDLLSEYIAAVEHGELVWPKTATDPAADKALKAAYTEHKYCTREAIYKGSKDGSTRHHLPDTVSAAALAWRAANQTQAAGMLSSTDREDIGTSALERIGEMRRRPGPGGMFRRRRLHND